MSTGPPPGGPGRASTEWGSPGAPWVSSPKESSGPVKVSKCDSLQGLRAPGRASSESGFPGAPGVGSPKESNGPVKVSRKWFTAAVCLMPRQKQPWGAQNGPGTPEAGRKLPEEGMPRRRRLSLATWREASEDAKEIMSVTDGVWG